MSDDSKSKKAQKIQNPSEKAGNKEDERATSSSRVPSHFFTPRKVFSQEVASSPLVSDQEMDTLRAECGEMLQAAENVIDEVSLSPAKMMGPPSSQMLPFETPNTKRDREVQQMLLQDLECSESERDTPFKSDTPRTKKFQSNLNVVSPDESTLQVTVPEPSTSAPRKEDFHKSRERRVSSTSSSEDAAEEDENSDSSGDELDVYSSKFNAKKALALGKDFLARLPFPNTKKLNNLDQYKLVISASDDPEDFEPNMIKALKKKPLSKKSKDYVSPSKTQETIKRKFLLHQMPVIRPSRESLQLKNVMDKMESAKGPMAKLVEYRDQKIRIMVKTRNLHQGTNDMVGYVVAFDKHWNLALTDVEETFLRKQRRKVPVNLGDQVKLSDRELAKRGLVKPKVIQKLGKNFELCKRHIPQLLLRGEHVVVISPVI